MDRGIYDLITTQQLNEGLDKKAIRLNEYMYDAFDDLDIINETWTYFGYDDEEQKELLTKLKDDYKIDIANLDYDLGYGYKLMPLNKLLDIDGIESKTPTVSVNWPSTFYHNGKGISYSDFIMEIGRLGIKKADNDTVTGVKIFLVARPNIKITTTDDEALQDVNNWGAAIEMNAWKFIKAEPDLNDDFPEYSIGYAVKEKDIPANEWSLIERNIKAFTRKVFEGALQLSYDKIHKAK